MSPLATLALASAGVYAYVALHFGGLWWMRRSASEHGAFALLSLSLVGLALSAARVISAGDVAEAATGQRAQYVFALLTIGAFVQFCSRVSGRPLAWLERGTWIVAGVTAALAAAGLFVDPAIPTSAFDGSVPGLGGRPAAALLPLGWLSLASGSALASIAIVHFGRAALRDRSLRATFTASLIPFAAGIWDLVVRWTGAPPPLVSSIAPVLAVGGISWALVGRFARVDADLATRTEELASSYDRLRHAQQELVRKEQLAAVGELSAVIAHEVRNPLAIIRNSVSGLRRSEIRPEDAETLLSILDEEADRLNRLVQDLLAYAKPADPAPQSIDLPDLLHRTIALAREGQAHRKNIEFAIQIDPAVSTVECDPALLRHALINIADNAMHAMPDGGTVAIRCRAAHIEHSPAVAIDFHDEGEGMDTLVRSKARDPFFTTRSTGTGLGLAIVERVARVHGGRVEIESRHGQGTTVTLLLPRERSSLPTPGAFS